MSNYPYIQNKKKIENGLCSVCKETKPVLEIEWRVDWFQGNCEFEIICQACLNNRKVQADKKQASYDKKMKPIWEKQKVKAEREEKEVEKIISNLGFSLKKFPNGQWSIGNILDWWTTTGTAIERKSRRQHYLSFSKPQEIRSVLEKLNTTPHLLK